MTAILNIPARRVGASDATVTIPHVEHPPWMDLRTPCKDDPDMWHADKDNEGYKRATRTAKWLCLNNCPVRELCKEHAITSGEGHGVWGGLTGKELTAERRARRLAR
jgi:WhiB family redox-sensing transcriptional regulator